MYLRYSDPAGKAGGVGRGSVVLAGRVSVVFLPAEDLIRQLFILSSISICVVVSEAVKWWAKNSGVIPA